MLARAVVCLCYPLIMEKSYNPFKMWGSWAGLAIGVLFAFNSFVYMEGDNPIQILQYLYLLNPFFLLSILLDRLAPQVALLGTLLTFLTTPFVFAFYGWGIQSLLRKFNSN